ncbi:MAG: methylenetetrahydrofolate--tRNA-(uracil(54)-C(5))-methyltransferase (FADH(2)-oxidizing) TrmFO [Limnochordia bacterium]|nr:methylenetetrahydrofolate--tRNA-(uracil(54)-C(5))-methyltransferase (FADH(2)-oxidizing) TrmFO [Bacillota bacterium]
MRVQNKRITVVGGGLAGCEAAWGAARLGVEVDLWEMRPANMTPAHETDQLAELVCSNSFGAQRVDSAPGLLKAEMVMLGSLLLECAAACQVPAGGALAVDREAFAAAVTERITAHPSIRLIRGEIDAIPPGIVVIATGPLTSPDLAAAIEKLTGEESLYFYDAAAPIVTTKSIDQEKGFWASRYGRGPADYFNCPLTKEQYEHFWEELTNAKVAAAHLPGEETKVFEACMPIEELARRGPQTLLFGPLKPVGLTDPRTGQRPFAVVQLRLENKLGTLMNMVGFQTRLRWDEQRRVFSLIPALAQAEFVRLGVMHRNTFIHSPRLLEPTGQLRKLPRVFFAGQLTGVEGYMESAASGLWAGINAARLAMGEEPLALPPTTMLGALLAHISNSPSQDFQPMNANYGLLPPLAQKIRNKARRNQALSERALKDMEAFLAKWQGLAPQ